MTISSAISSDNIDNFAKQIRADFPILNRLVREKPLVYLDNAATTQKPQCMIDAVNTFYTSYNANVHRGVHQLSEQATQHYENTRKVVANFIGAASSEEIVFVKGTTEAINLVANSFLRPRLQSGDEVLVTHMEHHSNIVPWQLLTEMCGASVAVLPITSHGILDEQYFDTMLHDKTKLLSVCHVSNTLGTINPIKRLITLAHQKNIPVMVDGAQAVSHMKVNMQDLDCDFYAFSGHKMFGPTGVGILYGKAELLETMIPYQGGGDMIEQVSFQGSSYRKPPYRFEAGTPNIAGVIGMEAAVTYLQSVGMDRIAAHEQHMVRYALEKLQQVPRLSLVGQAHERSGAISFCINGIHPHDLATLLDAEGVAIRAGHHCTMPIMEFFNVAATARASLACYNTREEIDSLVIALQKAQEMFKGWTR